MTTPARKPRCRKLDRRLNRCASEELEDTGLCLKHLREAAADWAALISERPELMLFQLPAGVA